MILSSPPLAAAMKFSSLSIACNEVNCMTSSTRSRAPVTLTTTPFCAVPNVWIVAVTPSGQRNSNVVDVACPWSPCTAGKRGPAEYPDRAKSKQTIDGTNQPARSEPSRAWLGVFVVRLFAFTAYCARRMTRTAPCFSPTTGRLRNLHPATTSGHSMFRPTDGARHRHPRACRVGARARRARITSSP